MALKLDELLTKKKEPVQILDLSKSSANSKEEFKKLLEKVPEFKIKMEKVLWYCLKSLGRIEMLIFIFRLFLEYI